MLEPVLAAVLAFVLYSFLQGELPYHDAARFANQVNSGRFVWDIGHILMQPATLLWHQYLGFGESAETSQKHINAVATALGIGIFDILLLNHKIKILRRIFALLLVSTSASLLTLAPSAHMKLLAFPFVNAALLTLAGWERGPSRGAACETRLLIGAGLLATAGAFLASALATAPFAAVGVWLTGLRRGSGWRQSLILSCAFALAFSLTFVLIAICGYSVFTGSVPTLHGLAGSVSDKADLRPGGYGLPATLARLAFGTANNIADAPDLGAIMRGWMAGGISSLSPYRRILLLEAGPLLVTLFLLAAVYLVTLYRGLSGARCLMPAAFLCGAQTWTIYYGLNDPEHWFQLTVPSILLFVTLFPSRFVRLVLPAWAILIASVNVLAFARPYASYPLGRYETQLKSTFGPNDLLVGFASFAGGPSINLMHLPEVPALMLDQKLLDEPGPAAFYSGVDRAIRDVLARHGRVVVFGGVLDPLDWNAPWASLPSHGVTKAALQAFFYGNYVVRPLGRVAEIPAWEILPK